MTGKRPTFTELFAGAGLLSHAFVNGGFTPLLAVELDPVACESYRRNVGKHIVCADVSTISPSGRPDVLVAGPPCQGFSTLNRSRLDDPRNQLGLEVLKWVRVCKPSIVVVENVAPFAESSTCHHILRSLRSRGYRARVELLDAYHYGTAQRRLRSFLVAANNSSDIIFPAPSQRRQTVKEAWANLPCPEEDEFGSAFPEPSELAYDRFKSVPEGGDRRDILALAPHLAPPSWSRISIGVNTGVWGRMRWESPSPTIRTNFQNPSKGRYIHPSQNRVITLREGARLQDIPDRWQFCGYRTQVTRQIGNGIPIRLGAAIAKMCLQMLG